MAASSSSNTSNLKRKLADGQACAPLQHYSEPPTQKKKKKIKKSTYQPNFFLACDSKHTYFCFLPYHYVYYISLTYFLYLNWFISSYSLMSKWYANIFPKINDIVMQRLHLHLNACFVFNCFPCYLSFYN